ncbi:MAG: precorrin-6y C5,15-methyltransferase (decarboxylating) subunit CbiE [Geitlerinemataceae cyanobacterium]
MGNIDVIGIGLEGAVGLSEAMQNKIREASLLMGSDRHLGYFPEYGGDRWILGDLGKAIDFLKSRMNDDRIVILVSGDPLFFGLGRLLLTEIPAECLTFHPHFSSIQLAFNRIKIPWQDARSISVHGRSLDELTQALQQGIEKIAVLTDGTNTPTAIAALFLALDLPTGYDIWVCENLGNTEERVICYDALSLISFPHLTFAPLNVVVFVRRDREETLDLDSLPHFGLPDSSFLSFADRPGLMTKREIRLLILGELALKDSQTVWDIGAGTGSVSIEIARFCPNSQIYAIEKTAVGVSLIQRNCDQFQVNNVKIFQGNAPESLEQLPTPDRIFIGGSGGNLTGILSVCSHRLSATGSIVLAVATLEHLAEALNWVKTQGWYHHLLQVSISRSVPIASLTRFAPLNPVTILTIGNK